MVSCEGCGGEIDVGVSECPYCGKSVKQSGEAEKSTIGSHESVYRTSTDEEGLTHIRFGDGQTGSRPQSSSGSASSQYRYGAGAQGNVGAQRLEEKLDRIERIPDPAKQKESKDLGVILMETFAEMGDLVSLYQSTVTEEAHLSTDDRDRLSRKEERVRPKLKSIVSFCERADSKTKKRIGLSDSEIHKIRTTASRVLQMTDVGKCAKCGTRNRPGSRNCQNCGAHL